MLIPEIVTLSIMAFAVGMDAFSVSLGLGIYKLRLRQIFYIGLTIGLFHMLMPLIGIFTGHLLSGTFGKITDFIGGALLVFIGLQMLSSSFSKEEGTIITPAGWGSLLFGLVVSLDSFSAGLSLGMFGVRVIAAVICFGAVSTLLTWCGLLLGRKVQHLIGAYGELLGGSILIAFGIKLIFLTG